MLMDTTTQEWVWRDPIFLSSLIPQNLETVLAYTHTWISYNFRVGTNRSNSGFRFYSALLCMLQHNRLSHCQIHGNVNNFTQVCNYPNNKLTNIYSYCYDLLQFCRLKNTLHQQLFLHYLQSDSNAQTHSPRFMLNALMRQIWNWPNSHKLKLNVFKFSK